MDNPENIEGAIKTGQSREYRRGNKNWTIQRNWQQDKDKQNKNTTQDVLGTTICKQTQIT
jgi:hypothetical protein